MRPGSAITLTEGQLDQAFADGLCQSIEMQNWLLEGGRFKRFSGHARLLVDEQVKARGKSVKNWARFWWSKLPDGSESETDLFLVFEAGSFRFAIHIENKPPHGTLRFDQASAYRRRAAFKANDAQWLNYVDFETVLLAPESFIEANWEPATQFDRVISYESVAAFVPSFGDILKSQGNE